MAQRNGANSRATIKDVAKRAAVSIGTVSRVINGHQDVEAGLRTRVESAMKDLHYRPSLRAQSFVRDRSPVIGFVVSNRHSFNTFHALLLLGVEEYCSQSGYYVLFSRHQYVAEAAPADLALPGILQNRGLSDSIILAGTNHANLLDALDRSGLRHVILANSLFGGETRPPLNRVRYDDAGGVAEATRYLAQLGHRDIWYIGDDSEPWHKTRQEAYRRVISELSLEPHIHAIAVSDDPFENGHAAVSLLIEHGSPVTAIFADSEELAYGVKEGLRQHGRDVPRDVSVIAFDHQTYRSRLPTLTSVCVDPVEVGRQLARLAIGRTESDADQPEILVPARLVKRSSCRPLRAEPSMLL
ncbi:MAG: LacI family DNA-binding transcriptional regulator [Candidatus Solibacter sp.]|jgi:DNA-binding LacI/PurR family transcriptional regulator